MAVAIILVLMIVGSAVFHFLSPWKFTEIASNWGSMDTTFDITFVITGIVFLAISFFMAYAIYRYHHKEGRVAHYEPENKKLEWILTILTTIGVAAMLAPGLVVWNEYITVPEGADELEAVGKQWQWSFRLPGKDGQLGTTDIRFINFENPFGINPDDPNGQDDILIAEPELHIPIDRPVKFNLRSIDVLHDFYVPQFRAKMDLVPGLVTYFWMTPIRTGKFDLLCAELCGVGHYTMRGHVVVDEAKDYEAWISSKPTFAQTISATGVVPATSGLAASGQALAGAQGCLACHSIDGTPGIGPTWKDLFGKTETMLDGSIVTVDEAYLTESITDPNAMVVEGFAPIMPPYEFSDEDLEALVEYIKQVSAPPAAAVDLNEAGQKVAEINGCLSCHSIDGSAGVGPTWKGLFGKSETLTDGSTVTVDEAFLGESISDPNATIIAGFAPIMPPFALSEEDMAAVIAYIKSKSE